MGDDVKILPEKTLYAQVETVWAVKDYPPVRNCVRLIAVDTYSFENQLFNSEQGCQTYVVDLDWRDAYPNWHRFAGPWGRGPCGADPESDEGEGCG